MTQEEMLAWADRCEVIANDATQMGKAFRRMVAEQRRGRPQGVPCCDPPYETHSCAIPDEMVEKIAECGE